MSTNPEMVRSVILSLIRDYQHAFRYGDLETLESMLVSIDAGETIDNSMLTKLSTIRARVVREGRGR